MANKLFPCIAFTHGGSYAVGNLITSLGCNSYMVDHNHMDDQHDPAQVIRTAKALGATIWIKSTGGVGYQNMRDQLMLFKNSEIAGYVGGFVHADECNRNVGDGAYVSIATLLEQQRAWREVFPGKPDLLNLLINTTTNAYAAGVMPKILGVDTYIKAAYDCSRVNTFGDVSWSCARLLDAYTAAGMTEAAGYRLAFYFGVFKHNRCDAAFTAAGVPLYGTEMMDAYYQAVYGAWGSKLGAAIFYAHKSDDAEDGYFPQDHPELWPVVQHLSSKIYNANLSSPYNVAAAPASNDSVNIISFASAVNARAGMHVYTLMWETTNATEVSIDGVGVVTGTSLDVTVLETRSYTLRAIGADGTVVTRTITITIGGVVFEAPTGLAAPPGIYTNSTLHIALSDPTENVITKLRAWTSINGVLYARGTCALDNDAKGFTFTSDASIGTDVALFYVEVNGVAEPHIEHYYVQVKRPYVEKTALVGSVGGTLAVNMITGMGEQISGATSSNTGVATVAWAGGAATITLKAAGTATIVLTPTVIQGYNPADFKITISVTVTAPVNETTGSGSAILTATGAVKLAGTATVTPPPISLSDVPIALWCYCDFENELLDPSSTILADLGFNAIILEVFAPGRTITQVLNKAQAKGVGVFLLCTRGGPDIEAISAGDLNAFGAAADEAKTHPAMRGYLTSDECDKTGSGGATGDALRKSNYAALVAKIHEHDTTHPTINVSTAGWASVSTMGAGDKAFSAQFLPLGDDALMFGAFPERETMSVITTRNGEAMTKFSGGLGLFLPAWRDAAGTLPVPSAQNIVDAAMSAKAFGTRFKLFAAWGWKDYNSPKMWSTIGDNATIYSNVKNAIAQIRASW